VSHDPNSNLNSETVPSETVPSETVETYPLCSEISINQSGTGRNREENYQPHSQDGMEPASTTGQLAEMNATLSDEFEEEGAEGNTAIN
jgi:hypothetical protein